MEPEDETTPLRIPQSGRHPETSDRDATPLQSRACFFKGIDWVSVTQINKGLCDHGKAHFGTSQNAEKTGEAWKYNRVRTLTLEEVAEFLQCCHKEQPFQNFNGNTFCMIGRSLAMTCIPETATMEARKIMVDAFAHYIAGVLGIEELRMLFTPEPKLEYKKGDRVETRNGSMVGTVDKILADGRVRILPDGWNGLATIATKRKPAAQQKTTDAPFELTEKKKLFSRFPKKNWTSYKVSTNTHSVSALIPLPTRGS